VIDLQPLWDWFRVLNESTGVKLTIFYDAFDRARFFNGFLTSVSLMAVCLVASVIIGVVGAWIQGSRLRALALSPRATSSSSATRRRWCSFTFSISRSART